MWLDSGLNKLLPLAFFSLSPGGYDIPAGARIMGNVIGIHKDPREWQDPDMFNPDRFLDKEGAFQTQPGWLPFSTGKRVCLGESLAKADLHLITSLLLQRFTFVPAPGEELSLDYKKGPSMLLPVPFKVIVQKRT